MRRLATIQTPQPQREGDDMTAVVIYPVQCECGHIYLEKYQLPEPNDNGEVGFCWCVFCRTKRMVKPVEIEERQMDDAREDAIRAADAAEERRIAALAPDKEKLNEYADALERIVPPSVSSDEAKAELLDAVRRIEAICEDMERFGE